MEDQRMNDILSRNLKNTRILRGWSQSFVANSLSISVRNLSRIENGSPVSPKLLRRLSRFYQVPLERLYSEGESCLDRHVCGVLTVEDAARLLSQSSFFNDFQHETILRFLNVAKEDTEMTREDIDLLIAESISSKKSYSYSDLVTVAYASSREVLRRIVEKAAG